MSMHFSNTLRNMLIASAIWKHDGKNYISMKLGNIFAKDKTTCPCRILLLAEVGANLNHHDRNGSLAALHMAVGYVRLDVTKLSARSHLWILRWRMTMEEQL
ncbi:hypothetical protein ACSQ67_018272 [Phaseolus vulgaris]